MNRRARPLSRTLVAFGAVVALAACSDTETTSSTEPAPDTAPPTETVAPTDTVPAETPATEPTEMTAPTETEPAIGGQVTTTNVAGTSGDVADFSTGLVLDPGATYALGDTFSSNGVAMTFTAPDVETHSYLVPGLAAVWADEFGVVSLVNVLDYRTAITYSVDSPDPTQLITVEDVQAIMTGTPSDPFKWMASRGYVTLGPIEETTFGGFPARVTEYEFVEIEDGSACFPTDPRPCIWTFGSFDTSITYFAGETGTFVDVNVNGKPYLIDIRDQPGAAEIAESLVIIDTDG